MCESISARHIFLLHSHSSIFLLPFTDLFAESVPFGEAVSGPQNVVLRHRPVFVLRDDCVR